MKKRLFPLIIGILIGIILGIGESVPTLRLTEWISHGLYNTAIKLVVTSVNKHALIACVAFYFIWLAIAMRARMNGWLRRVPETVIVACLLIVFSSDLFKKIAIILSDIKSKLADIDFGVFRLMCADSAPQIIAAVLVLVSGIFIIIKKHRSNINNAAPQKAEITTQKFPLLVELLSSIKHYASVVAQGHWGIYAIVLIIFVTLNIIMVGFSVNNAQKLRSRPNILLIQIDTLRPDHLGCYGYKRMTSPNIDKLASESMKFEKAIAPAPWTTPSVAQFMTGRYLKDVSFDRLTSGKSRNNVSIAEALKDHGYSTAGINTNLLAGSGRGFADGFDSYDEYFYRDVSSPELYSKAVERLDTLKNKKFFMFLLFLDVHSPYIVHDKYNYYPEYKGKLGKEINLEYQDRVQDLTKDDMKYMNAAYDSEITYTDEYIGKLMRKLKKMNLYNDTLIILLADHGEEFGDHGRLGHGYKLYDESLSVPLIIKLPGQRKGSTVGGVFPLLDIFPTIMDTINLDPSYLHLDGTVKHLQGLMRINDQDIYSSTNFGGSDKSSVRTNSYKLISDKKSSKQELYSLKLDPTEKKNVLKSQPSMASNLSIRLNEIDQEIDRIATNTTSSGSGKMSAKDIEKLKSLGYIGAGTNGNSHTKQRTSTKALPAKQRTENKTLPVKQRI